MNRREFLKYFTVLGASVTLGKTSAYAKWLTNEERNGFPMGMLLIDAHAHPDQFYYMGPREGEQWTNWCAQFCDESSTLEKIMELGMHNSSFAAIGDSNNGPFTFDQAMNQVNRIINLEEQGLLRFVRRHKDMPHGGPPKGFIPGAILSLEGASPLGSDEDTVFKNLDILYECGVRMITLMHYLDNEFGEAMRRDHPGKEGTGLTDLGQQVVKRMMSLGMVADVAHAHYATLKDIGEIAKVNGIPVIDSHTSLSPLAEPNGGRLRTWEEMEIVAASGGVICTWPLKWEASGWSGRLTLLDWAEENYKMKERLGSEHIALGTDGGGVLPDLVDGYGSILDLPKLLEAMDEVGFKRSEIEAYMGGNLFRVIKQCIG